MERRVHFELFVLLLMIGLHGLAFGAGVVDEQPVIRSTELSVTATNKTSEVSPALTDVIDATWKSIEEIVHIMEEVIKHFVDAIKGGLKEIFDIFHEQNDGKRGGDDILRRMHEFSRRVQPLEPSNGLESKDAFSKLQKALREESVSNNVKSAVKLISSLAKSKDEDNQELTHSGAWLKSAVRELLQASGHLKNVTTPIPVTTSTFIPYSNMSKESKIEHIIEQNNKLLNTTFDGAKNTFLKAVGKAQAKIADVAADYGHQGMSKAVEALQEAYDRNPDQECSGGDCAAQAVAKLLHKEQLSKYLPVLVGLSHNKLVMKKAQGVVEGKTSIADLAASVKVATLLEGLKEKTHGTTGMYGSLLKLVMAGARQYYSPAIRTGNDTSLVVIVHQHVATSLRSVVSVLKAVLKHLQAFVVKPTTKPPFAYNTYNSRRIVMAILEAKVEILTLFLEHLTEDTPQTTTGSTTSPLAISTSAVSFPVNTTSPTAANTSLSTDIWEIVKKTSKEVLIRLAAEIVRHHSGTTGAPTTSGANDTLVASPASNGTLRSYDRAGHSAVEVEKELPSPLEHLHLRTIAEKLIRKLNGGEKIEKIISALKKLPTSEEGNSNEAVAETPGLASILRETVMGQLKRVKTSPAKWVASQMASGRESLPQTTSSNTTPVQANLDTNKALLMDILKLFIEILVQILKNVLADLGSKEKPMVTTSPPNACTTTPTGSARPGTGTTPGLVETTTPAVKEGFQWSPERLRELESVMNTVNAALTEYTNKERKKCLPSTCPDPPIDAEITGEQAKAFLARFLDGILPRTRKSKPGMTTKISYGKTANGEALSVIRVRPYYGRSVRNAKQYLNRSAIWIEAGFEGCNRIGPSVTMLLIDFLEQKCKVYCNYDYYIVPLVNPDGFNSTNSSWCKTDQSFSGTTCKGVDLLSNFAQGNFSAGDKNHCSPKYRGPSAMSAIETKYQSVIKDSVKNIALSITLTKLGAVVSTPYAHTNQSPSTFKELSPYLSYFKKGSHNYTSGTYSTLHGIETGHPLDYNAARNKWSFNVALEKGNVTSDPHVYAKNQYQEIFSNFVRGLFAMITHAKNDQNLKR